MLLPLVLLVAGMLLVMGLAVWRTNQTDVQQITVNVRRVQAQYLAKGALQLALLKARLFPTPLYDAAAYSVGKNPYYVHSSGYAHLSGAQNPQADIIPGPAFLTGDVTLKSGLVERLNIKKIPGASATDTQSDNLNTEDGLVSGDYRVDRYLNYFALDLADVSVVSPLMVDPPAVRVTGQDRISISTSSSCPILGKPDPYGGTFRILVISVQGARNNKQYGEETLRVVAQATIVSKMAGEYFRPWTEREDTFYKVKRPY
ncbi:MAG: hypothetical protein HY816_08650 [Candidatus Wallbacteria bacterium]|nr:hypothetical protein [Candidatus Wallbacteria bacterium]